MEIKYYLLIFWRNKWVILITTMATVSVVTIFSSKEKPIYTASATLRVATSSTASLGYTSYSYADRIMNTYILIATSRPVLEELASKLNVQPLPQLSVGIIPNTELLKISVTSTSPGLAQMTANTLAEILTSQGKQLYSGEGTSPLEILGEQLKQAEDEYNQARQEYDAYASEHPDDEDHLAVLDQTAQLKQSIYANLKGQYNQVQLRETIGANLLSVVEPAESPVAPSKSNRLRNIALGFMVGIAGGVGLAFLKENLDTRLHTSKQIEAATELDLIGKIPTMERRKWFRLRKGDDKTIDTPFQEAFRRLQVKILSQNPGKKVSYKTLLVTSSKPGEGKSTVTNHLAIAMAESGKKVIVVDCDLHFPTQQAINGLSNLVGLSTVLNKEASIAEAVRKSSIEGMDILTSGPQPANPTQLLGSPQMKTLIQELSKQYDMVLLDTPALLVVADTALLMPIVDRVILVARRNFIQEEAVRESCRQLADMQARTIDLVVNEAERNGTYYYYHQR